MTSPPFSSVWDDRMCKFCLQHEASHFCRCTGSPILFCLVCGFTHQAKYPRAVHQVIPIAALSQNPEEYMRKYETLVEAIAALRSNVDRMEQCAREFAVMMQTCLNYLTEYRSWWLQHLQTEKEQLVFAIETAIQEVTNCLDQGREPGSALGRALWTFPNEDIQVFTYTVNTPDLPTLSRSWAQYESRLKSLCLQTEGPTMQTVSVESSQDAKAESPTPLPEVSDSDEDRTEQPARQARWLVRVTKSFFQFFDFQSEGWEQTQTPLTPNIQADSHSGWIVLEDRSVFVCGGGYPGGWNTAFIVGEARVEQQTDMHVARYYHGMLDYNNSTIYVFGGCKFYTRQ